MADPVTLTAGIGWGLTAASWLISPILSRLVNKCFDALGKDHDQRKSLDDKLRDLQTTLLPQLIILTDAAQRSPHRRQLEAWLQNLKSAYYEVEHLHGLVEYTQLEKKANTSFPPASKLKYWYNSKLNNVVLNSRKKDLLESLKKLEKIVDKDSSKLVAMLNLSTNSVNNSNPRPNEKRSEHSNQTISGFGGLKVIGRDKDREQIKNLLRMETPGSSEDNAKCYSVIGIWGMGGSGKTTLAQYICEYERKNSKYFDLVMWAHVSQNFSVETIYRRILESLREHHKYNSIEGLYAQLKEKLKGQRFLLVLDDAWCHEGVSEQQFQQLFAPLQEAQRGSKILVTTRIEGAAKALGATELIALRQLDQAEFLELFMSQALCNMKEKCLEERLKPIGEQIAKKLCRSPLAATTVAAQLRQRLEPDFWLSMCEQNLLNATMGALLLSYQNLPPHLQRCFAFCSLFPKGHKFSQDRLVSLWIGEGFIETEDSNRHVRDIGNEYILELISSSFLQVERKYWNGKEIYSVHDLLHDLAEQVSKGDCFRIEWNEKRDIPTQTRHLYVHVGMFEEYIEKICKLKDLHTIIFGSRGILKEEDLNALFKRSKKFYVVDFYNCSIDGFPKNVLTLKNLRYFNSGYSDVTKFPKPSTGLYQLRLLRGEDRIGYSKIQIPDVGRLTLLQDLTVFRVRDVRGCGLEQLEHLRDLYGKLVICDLKNVNNSQEACRVKLFDKKGLRVLELKWTKSSDVDFFYSDNPNEIKDAEDILDALCPPPQLEKLRIESYKGKRCPKWFLEYNKNTTHLKELDLSGCMFLEALPETNNLIHLQSLTIFCLPMLKTWASLPSNLVNLTLIGCSSLAFLSEEDLKVRMSTQSGDEPSPIYRGLEKHMSDFGWRKYIVRLEELDRISSSKEVNRELYLPLTLEKLEMSFCFISDQALASSLKGHTSLTHLELCGIIPVTCIPREVLSSLTNLRVLSIRMCWMLTSVDGLNTLSSLEVLQIKDCPCLPIESLDLSNSKLRELKIENCPCLESLDMSNSKLRELKIKNCPCLESLDMSNSKLRELKIKNCPCLESLDMSNSESLSSLSLRMCTNLVSLMGLNELNNLKDLSIVGCDKLQCSSDANKLPGVRGHLTISKLSMLELVSRDGLSSQVSLIIKNAEQEYFTPEECEMLSHLSSLERIRFENCKMRSLPDLSCLKSLTKLEISSCKDLISLSELPPSVQHISISYCNVEFVRSCKDSNHPNCQKISHIPKKHIYEGFWWNSSNQMNDG